LSKTCANRTVQAYSEDGLRHRDSEELFLMAACDEHIMANSTFSWWGAWLGNCLSLIPRDWRPPFGSTALFTTARSIVLDVPRVAGTVA